MLYAPAYETLTPSIFILLESCLNCALFWALIETSRSVFSLKLPRNMTYVELIKL